MVNVGGGGSGSGSVVGVPRWRRVEVSIACARPYDIRFWRETGYGGRR